MFRKWLDKRRDPSEISTQDLLAIKKSLLQMSKTKTGALIMVGSDVHLEPFSETGVKLDAVITQPLIESIFAKESPLHDGAVILSRGRIYAASCILPISGSPSLPKQFGLRHRAGVGATENTNVAVFIVSEERGDISFAHRGLIKSQCTPDEIEQLIQEHYF